MDSLSGHAPITLESRFVDLDAPVLLTGIQALVRLLLEQSRLDRMAGLRTAGLVSGYRGSPLGGLDKELWQRRRLLDAHDIRFQPGLNEDLGATMLWGAQMVDVFPGKRFDGVFTLWYGKGPGVDRSGDALRHVNYFGTARHGGAIAVAGDDHAAQSSVLPHQTDQIFEAVMMPVLNPAGVEEVLSFGLAGLAMSRFCGLWVALKTIAETIEGAATLVVPSSRRYAVPADVVIPPHGLNLDPTLRWPGQRAELERRVVEERLPAAVAFARANAFDRVLWGRPDAPIGIVTAGKAHLDVIRALDDLGLPPDRAAAAGIALYKVAMTWPLEPEGLARFATGKRAVLVVEEKRSLVERQARDLLYNLPADRRPAIAGKRGLNGAPLLPEAGEFSPATVAGALARFLGTLGITAAPPVLDMPPPAEALKRAPFFCAGCPHNTSTVVPDGSQALGGIGCHTLALGEVGRAKTVTHMGAEGVTWVGLAPFTEIPHMFVNMGDGTYQHSGVLAIRQAVLAGARMTYKLLYNSAVAMTGGQPVDGGPSVAQIATQLAAEGVTRIAVIADDGARLPAARDLPPGTERHTREALREVQRRFRELPGVTVIIYDQICATEKRRKRKRGAMAIPEVSVVINERVCENCGDCTVQSNCVAIEPVETPYGRKRRISPSTCNTDLSCLKGFCPSFVTVGTARRPPRPAARILEMEAEFARSLPAPPLGTIGDRPWRALFAGVGGGGIVTTGAIVAMAAHLEGRAVRTLDFTGLAQKNGAVVGHVHVARDEAALDVARVPLRGADLMLAADMAVAAGRDVLPRVKRDAAVIGNGTLGAVAALVRDPDVVLDSALHRSAIEAAIPEGAALWLDAARIAEALFGEAQAMNTILLGAAFQRGRVPLREASLLRAIELNGAAVEVNRRAFLWGRALGHDPKLAEALLATPRAPDSLDAIVAERAVELVRYQDDRLARRYRALVERAAAREAEVAGAPGAFARAVAEGYFHVLAYKDEYEVARLLSDEAFLGSLRETFGPEAPLTFHLSPPIPFLGRDPATGRRRKLALSGRWMLPVFRLLRRGRRLRGTLADPFRWQEDRRLERAMIVAFEQDVEAALAHLSPPTLATAIELVRLPFAVRGFGPLKRTSHARAEARRAALRADLAAPQPGRVAAPAVAQ
ncbi:indolepyruvate ferredoxin oxidoreductase family protein [Elioraea sp. Yellowstone]|jgi:indolepyruvate ferredoxin oxidoreductase|uniref:indolepyruvate ferredoxin oxidoreductase family protein n=1 Tax=Elioraea sp. Yellowstone TaxID=2592070 RepID=UPI00114E62C1|nr:indolepyruvate ferredoxin oxidoreductase family protein [Elioraea sp. Yellowstone]TQF76747.1 indolepyruvate ferredoxin oxidoreductase family protein [Elioraea sp. Yellowstone]